MPYLKTEIPTKNTLKTAIEIFSLAKRVEGSKKGSIEQYHLVLTPFLKTIGNISVDEITVHTVRQYLTLLEEKKLSKATFHYRFIRLKSFFDFLLKEKIISSSPIELIRKPPLPKQYPYIFQEHQIEALLKAVNKNTWEGYRNYAIISTLLDTGVRASELINLKLKDLNMAMRSITIRSGKGDRDREVFMGNKLVKAIHKWLETRGFFPYEETVFITRKGELLKRRHLAKIIQRLGEKAKINTSRCSPHTFRHTFATFYIKNGGDPFTLQRLLGHSEIQTTMIYVHMAGKDLREAHARYSPLDRL